MIKLTFIILFSVIYSLQNVGGQKVPKYLDLAEKYCNKNADNRACETACNKAYGYKTVSRSKCTKRRNKHGRGPSDNTRFCRCFFRQESNERCRSNQDCKETEGYYCNKYQKNSRDQSKYGICTEPSQSCRTSGFYCNDEFQCCQPTYTCQKEKERGASKFAMKRCIRNPNLKSNNNDNKEGLVMANGDNGVNGPSGTSAPEGLGFVATDASVNNNTIG